MINRILMELYDEYEKGNVEALKEFAKKTFPSDGTHTLFIGCVILMFQRNSGYKPRYYCTREHLESIVLAAKEQYNGTNLLAYYFQNINPYKGVKKYFKDVLESPELVRYADLILDYLADFKPNFIRSVKYNIEQKEKE